MTSLPDNPFPERKIKLRIEMIDPDGVKKGVQAEVQESYLTDIRIDPRDVLFKALQDMGHKLLSETFPDVPTEPVFKQDFGPMPPFPTLNPDTRREEQNEAIADMAKLFQKRGDL